MARDGEVIQMQHFCHHGHRRTGQHPLGGQTEFARMDSVGGGRVVATNFRGPYSVGGSSRNFP